MKKNIYKKCLWKELIFRPQTTSLTIALILLGMESTRLWNRSTSVATSCHAFNTLFHNSSDVRTGGSVQLERRIPFTLACKFSMGFILGEFGGHLSRSISGLLLNHSCIRSAVCTGWLSCWK